MKKRFLSLVLAVAMMVSFCVTVPVFAEQPRTSNVELNVDVKSTKTDYKPGETVTVDLNLQNYNANSVGIAGFQIELNFNSEVFDVTSVKKASSLKVNENESVNTNFKGPEKTFVMLYNAKTDNPAEELGGKPLGEIETDNQGSYYILPKNNGKIATIELPVKKDITADMLKKDIVTSNKLIFAARGGINSDGSIKGDKINSTFSQTPINVVMPKVSSINVTAQPTKTQYFVGDTLDVTGGIITATKDDGTTATHAITAGMVTGFDSATAGEKTLTVTFEKATATFKVTVKTIRATALSNVTHNAPIKGTTYEPKGTVDITYNNGKVETVNYPDEKIGTAVTTTVNTETINSDGSITVELGDLSIVKEKIQVFENKITKAVITKAPTKISFPQGSKFATDGEVEVTYADGKTEVLSISVANCKAPDMNKLGAQTVTINTFGDGVLTEILEKDLPTYEITIVEKALISIALNNAPTEVFETQNIDLTGMTVTGTYDNDSSELIDLKSMPITISGYDKSTQASATPVTVTVTVGGKTATFPIAVKARSLTGISVKTTPTSTSYTEGTKVDLTGGELALKYNVGEDGVLSMTDKGVTADALPAAVGAATIKVHYSDLSADLPITVIAKIPESIAVTKLPIKRAYYIGQAFDKTGMVVMLTYNNKTTAEVTDFKVEGFDAATVGKQTLTVSYTENAVTMTTTFEVTVDDKKVASIEVSTQPKAEFIECQDFVVTGGKLSVRYEDMDLIETIDMATDMCSNFDMTKIGEQTVTVTYRDKTTTYKINIRAKTLSSITATAPTKVEYLEGTDFDTTYAGMAVTAHYDNGKTAPVENKAVTVSGYDKTKVGDQDIKVAYTERDITKETTFKVKVISKQVVEEIKADLAKYQKDHKKDSPSIDLYRLVRNLGIKWDKLSAVEKEALASLRPQYDKLLGEITGEVTPPQHDIVGIGGKLVISAGAGNLFYDETILAEPIKVTDEFAQSIKAQFGDNSTVLEIFNANLIKKATQEPAFLKEGDVSILSYSLDVGKETGLTADNVLVMVMDKAGAKAKSRAKAAPQVIAAEVKGSVVTFKGEPNKQYAVIKAEKSVPVPPTPEPEKPGTVVTPTTPVTPLAPKPTTPTTGDASSIPMLIVIALFTAGLGVVIVKKKHTK